ncbi:hypothetical protein DFH28DRAFT_530769 [Melampsora americana]|nr:hypothetical protein DFH28DRAFT_530769 [Melampsora americana]
MHISSIIRSSALVFLCDLITYTHGFFVALVETHQDLPQRARSLGRAEAGFEKHKQVLQKKMGPEHLLEDPTLEPSWLSLKVGDSEMKGPSSTTKEMPVPVFYAGQGSNQGRFPSSSSFNLQERKDLRNTQTIMLQQNFRKTDAELGRPHLNLAQVEGPKTHCSPPHAKGSGHTIHKPIASRISNDKPKSWFQSLGVNHIQYSSYSSDPTLLKPQYKCKTVPSSLEEDQVHQPKPKKRKTAFDHTRDASKKHQEYHIDINNHFQSKSINKPHQITYRNIQQDSQTSKANDSNTLIQRDCLPRRYVQGLSIHEKGRGEYTILSSPQVTVRKLLPHWSKAAKVDEAFLDSPVNPVFLSSIKILHEWVKKLSVKEWRDEQTKPQRIPVGVIRKVEISTYAFLIMLLDIMKILGNERDHTYIEIHLQNASQWLCRVWDKVTDIEIKPLPGKQTSITKIAAQGLSLEGASSGLLRMPFVKSRDGYIISYIVSKWISQTNPQWLAKLPNYEYDRNPSESRKIIMNSQDMYWVVKRSGQNWKTVFKNIN